MSVLKNIIRLVFITADHDYLRQRVSSEYVLDKFRNATDRKILPDYDIVVDYLTYGAELESSVRAFEAYRSEEPYQAVIGPHTESLDCFLLANVSASANVLYMNNCITPAGSSRAQFPYMFRSQGYVKGDLNAWLYIAVSNAWYNILSLWRSPEWVDLWIASSQRYNITNYALVAPVGNEWLTGAWQIDAVERMRENRLRVVILHSGQEEDAYRFTCFVHRSQIFGVQYFMYFFLDVDWYLASYPASAGDCTPGEMYDAVFGIVASIHSPAPPGVQLFDINIPVPPGQTSLEEVHHTCMPGIPMGDHYTNGEIIMRGIEAGSIVDVVSAVGTIGWFGGIADGMCAMLVAFHDVLYNKGVGFEQVHQREDDAFQALIHSMEQVQFDSLTGDFQYAPGSMYRNPSFFFIIQQAVPWANGTMHVLATAIYPDGLDNEPVVTLVDPARDFLWKDGSTGLGPKPELGLFPDCSLINAELVGDSCRLCAPGKAYAKLSCTTCPLGEYQSSSGSAECEAALPGWFVKDTLEPTESLRCPLGMECPQFRTTIPQSCLQGRYAFQTGLASCELCPRGTYQDRTGATACTACEDQIQGSTTADIASVSATQCICPVGTYYPEGQTQCVSCPAGMVCAEGSDERNVWEDSSGPYPEVLAGYMTLASDPLRVYACKEVEHCPGGAPAQCGENRDVTTVACGSCLDSAYESGDACRVCGNVGYLPLLLSASVGIALAVLGTLLVNKSFRATPSATFMIATIFGMLFASLQAMGVFREMLVPWKEPVKGMLGWLQLVSFDLRFLRVTCAVGTDPVRSFAMRQLLPLCALLCIAGTLIVKKMLCRLSRNMDLAAEVMNASGAIFSVFFISIVVSAVSPFLCYKHPSGNGESVLSAPALLCFEDSDHTTMVFVGLIALCCIPLPFLASCFVGVGLYHTYVTAEDSEKFFHSFRFLFYRYKPQRYYFQCILLTRGLLLCLVPAMFRGQPSTQVVFIFIVLMGYIILEAQQYPWRAKVCNPIHIAMNAMLSLALVCGGLYLQDTPQADFVNVLCASCFIFVFLLAFIGLIGAIRRRLVPRPVFDFFLCHHKAHAAAQTRFLKMRLLERRRWINVFIDSDDLHHLDMLFDTVKSKVRRLIVYLTADTLKRPWCAGEITSAMFAHIPITNVQTPAFIAPSEEQLSSPETYIDTTACNLREYGMQWEDIRAAFAHFLQKAPVIPWSTAQGTRRFEAVAAQLLQQGLAVEEAPELAEAENASIVVSSHLSDDEATASSGILIAQISEFVYHEYSKGICFMANSIGDVEAAKKLTRNAEAVIVILSAGCLEEAQFVSVICEVQRLREHGADAPKAVSVNTPGFMIPAVGELSAVLPDLDESYGNVPSQYVLTFFKRISIFFPTHASQEALRTQSDKVVESLRKKYKKASSVLQHDSGSRTKLPAGLEGATSSRSIPDHEIVTLEV